MLKVKNIVIVSDSSFVSKLKNLKRVKSEDLKVLIGKEEIDVPNGAKIGKNVYQQSVILAKNYMENPLISKAFDLDGVNILEAKINQINLFIIRMILSFSSIKRICGKNRNLKLILFKKEVFGYSDSPFNSNFFPLAFYLWSKIHPKIGIKLIKGRHARNQKKI
jgi:hypothetical protein